MRAIQFGVGACRYLHEDHQGINVRRIRALGGHTDDDGVRVDARERESLPAAPSREQEALLIAERLAALVESRRAESSAASRSGSTGGSTGGSSEARSAPVVGARHSGRLLGNLLLTRGFIVESELQYALARQAQTGGPLGQILVDLGLIADRDLVELLAEQLRMQVIDPSRVESDPATRSLLSGAAARRLAALPLRRAEGHIDVVVADPSDDDAVAELTRLVGAPLRLFLASRADIEAAVERLYG